MVPSSAAAFWKIHLLMRFIASENVSHPTSANSFLRCIIIACLVSGNSIFFDSFFNLFFLSGCPGPKSRGLV